MLNSLRSKTHLTRTELTLRSSLLLRAERAVGQHNSFSNRGFNMAINKFSIMVSDSVVHIVGRFDFTIMFSLVR